MQQHVKSMQSVTPPHSPPPNRSYQGVKPTIGADTYSMDHLRKWKEEAKVAPVGHQSYQGVKPQIDQDNFLYSEMKRSRENMLQSERFAAKSLKPHVGNDAKMFDHAKAMKVQQQQPPTDRVAAQSLYGSRHQGGTRLVQHACDKGSDATDVTHDVPWRQAGDGW